MSRSTATLLAFVTLACTQPFAQNVKITPLGSHAGELCARDRATLFEDPTGVRILYDAGQSVTGGDDARLGTVHVVLLSHAHGDHIGDQRLKAPGAGTCDSPEVVSAAPNSTTAEIAAAKNAAIVMIAPMANFVGRKVEAIKGKPTAACAQTGSDLVVPFAAPCTAGVNDRRNPQREGERRGARGRDHGRRRPRTTAPCRASCSRIPCARASSPTA